VSGFRVFSVFRGSAFFRKIVAAGEQVRRLQCRERKARSHLCVLRASAVQTSIPENLHSRRGLRAIVSRMDTDF